MKQKNYSVRPYWDSRAMDEKTKLSRIMLTVNLPGVHQFRITVRVRSTNIVQHILPDIVMHYHPNLILLDISLPDKLGTDVCKELKQIHKNLPILLFSAHADEGQAFAICDAGGFIEKPFDIKNLINTINLHVN